MTIIITSREFNQGSSSALKVAETEPVYITKRGKITNVILSYAHYQQIIPSEKTFADYFSAPHSAAEVDLDADLPQRNEMNWQIRDEDVE